VSVFVSTTFAPLDSRLTEVVDALLAAGVRRIELGSTHCYEGGLGEALEKRPAEYLVHNYCPAPREPFVVNIASLDAAVRARSLAHIVESLEFCARIGARLYTFHPGFLSDPEGPSQSTSNHDFRFRSVEGRDYERAWAHFVEGCRSIAVEARARGVRVAVETQGAVARREELLLQRPGEMRRLFAEVADAGVEINLNLAHLALAANAFGFERAELVDVAARRLAAVEVSHNEGVHDEHRPLVDGAWYWSVIRAAELRAVPIILETRDTPLATIVACATAMEAARASGEQAVAR